MSNRTVNSEVTCPVCQTPGAALHQYEYLTWPNPEPTYQLLVLDCVNGCQPTEDQLKPLTSSYV
jgi:hypothetical protein